MITTIYAILTRCRNHKPLVLLKQLNDQPFRGIAVDPEALRDMAQRLMHIADVADAMQTSARQFVPKHITVPIKLANCREIAPKWAAHL